MGRICDVSGEEYVGCFGVSITPTPIKRLKGKRRQPVATDGTSDEYVQQLVNTGIVKDILIEAQRLPDSAGVKGMHLCTREGYADLD